MCNRENLNQNFGAESYSNYNKWKIRSEVVSQIFKKSLIKHFLKASFGFNIFYYIKVWLYFCSKFHSKYWGKKKKYDIPTITVLCSTSDALIFHHSSHIDLWYSKKCVWLNGNAATLERLLNSDQLKTLFCIVSYILCGMDSYLVIFIRNDRGSKYFTSYL